MNELDAEAAAMTSRGTARVDATAALPSAFEDLFRAEYARVVRIAHRVLADEAAAEDVAQEVFVSFYQKHTADAGYAPAWLHAAAAHAALNALRSRARRARRETGHAPADRGSDPAQEALDAERRAEVREALARLPKTSAAVLALRYSGLSYAEVAAALGVGANGIGTLLLRAEERFRKEVTR